MNQQTQSPPQSAVGAAPVRPLGVRYAMGQRLPVFEVGQEIQLFRLGPLHDRITGEYIATITDEMCAEMVRVFAAQTAEGVAVPIDWNHGTENPDVAPHMAVTFGRIVAMRHEPGVGLWGEPGYNAAGVAQVTACGGALFTSPAFVLAGRFGSPSVPAEVGAYLKSTGERIGDCQITSVALTPTPAQNGMAAVLMSETIPPRGAAQPKEGRMAENTAPVAPPAPAVALAEPPPAPAAEPTKTAEMPSESEKDAMIASLQEQVAALTAQLQAMQASVAAGGEKAAAEALSEIVKLRRDLKQLSDSASASARKIAEAEKAAANERLERELDSYEAKGYFAPARRPEMKELAEVSRSLFDRTVKRLSEHPEVKLGHVGHGQKGKQSDDSLDARTDALVVQLAQKRGWDLAKDPSKYPVAYAAVTRGEKE